MLMIESKTFAAYVITMADGVDVSTDVIAPIPWADLSASSAFSTGTELIPLMYEK